MGAANRAKYAFPMRLPEDPPLRDWAERLESLGWAFFILDGDLRLAYVSKELSAFLGTEDSDLLGIGDHMAKWVLGSPFIEKMPLEDQMRMFSDTMPFLVDGITDRERFVQELEEPLATLLGQVEPVPLPSVWASHFGWQEGDLAPYPVHVAAMAIRDETGRLVGAVFVHFLGVRPSLLVLLARGSEDMYERMAGLVEPRRRQAAILFVDLEDSGLLSRGLPTSVYFELVRKLATCIDDSVARRTGVVGKHAGDGGSALFLVDDLGSASAAAAAAVDTARALVDMAADLGPATTADVPQPVLNVGLHWGASLYVGQLVPGGRLDVAALGDEMTQCARIQECARGGAVLASKALLEHLDADDAARVGVELAKLSYRPLADLDTAGDKAVRDAGGLPVTRL